MLQSRMLRRGRWKYCYYHGYPDQLFDLDDDPDEMVDLARDAGHRAVRDELRALVLEDWDPEHCVAANFMTITFDVTEKGQEMAPAAIHVDATARPQTVTQELNPDAHAILKAYEARTGDPVLINTSFNMHEEPIVCTPDDAVRAFLQGHLHVLSIGSFIPAIAATWLERPATAMPILFARMAPRLVCTPVTRPFSMSIPVAKPLRSQR